MTVTRSRARFQFPLNQVSKAAGFTRLRPSAGDAAGGSSSCGVSDVRLMRVAASRLISGPGCFGGLQLLISEVCGWYDSCPDVGRAFDQSVQCWSRLWGILRGVIHRASAGGRGGFCPRREGQQVRAWAFLKIEALVMPAALLPAVLVPVLQHLLRQRWMKVALVREITLLVWATDP